MEATKSIYYKLNLFYKKFYINKLIKGSILFIAIGLLYLILTALIENFLWLSTVSRAFLFWLFILIEVALLLNFILIPIFELAKIKKGIDYVAAAKIIQQHFPDKVGDKLLNFLQLNEEVKKSQSDLLVAAIEQKTLELQPIPFLQAISLKKNVKYLPYVAIPVVLILLFIFTGKHQNLKQSFLRVSNYSQIYEKPAPFTFQILNENFLVKENESFTLEFKTVGNVIPDRVAVHFNDESYFAEKIKPGHFKFNFSAVHTTLSFYLEANTFTSKLFQIEVIPIPVLADIQVSVKIPSHVSGDFLKNTNSGNLIVPEGSVITWQVKAQNADVVKWISDTVSSDFTYQKNDFVYSKKLKNSLDYQITTTNSISNDSQQVNYHIDVIKDEYPLLSVLEIPDSIAQGKKIYHGKASDDYGISKLSVVYFDTKHPNKLYKYGLPVQNKTNTSFVYQFPQGLNLEENITYTYYFEVIDNDVVNNYKSVKSAYFSHNELNQIQKNDENLNKQMQQINALEKSLGQAKTSDKKVNEVNQLLKQSSNLEYKDIKKLQDFFNSEIENNKRIEEAAKKLAEKLDERDKNSNTEKAKELEKRLENLQKEQEKNKKLYNELQKYTDKLTKEQLIQKMQQAKQNAAQQKRSLEQLVEQTKRFYVEQRAEQITEKLKKLAEKQEKFSEVNTDQLQNQLELNKAFDDIQSDLHELKHENDGLKKPMELPKMDADSEDTKQEMNKASNQLKENNKAAAKKSQKSAAQKMKEMAEKLESGMQKDEADQLQEDAKALRQILKNLLKFSFTQESTMKAFKSNGSQSFHFNRLLKEEQKLKNQFKFIDDSLYTLASRQIRIQDVVNKSVSEIHYNIDQSLHHLVENNLNKGISHQQYVINHANVLADLLSEALSNIQNQMQQQQGSGKGNPSPGQGKPQLSDIIQKQKGLEQKFGEGLQKKEGEKPNGQNPGEKSGSSGNENKSGNDGLEGESEELLEIYKEQQQLREALQNAIESTPGNSELEKTLAEMKKLERNLLRKGFSNELLNQFKNLNHELLKLQNALKEQGDDTKRQSNTNENKFNANENQIPKSVLEYIQGTEILQKNTLPLQPKYDNLVKEYFK